MRTVDTVTTALHAIATGRRANELECEWLEFKEESRSEGDTVRTMLEAALCFANAQGGYVVLGVSDKHPGAAAFVGCSIDADLLKRRIHELSRPPLLVDVLVHRVGDSRLVIVRVPESTEVHCDMQGRAPRRLGTDCISMDAREQARLVHDRSGTDWSSAASSRRATEASREALAAARSLLASFPDNRRKLASLGDEDLLRALGVVRADGILLNAGATLFCTPEVSAGPVVVYQYRATPAGEPRAIERLEIPVLLSFQRALELVGARRNIVPVTLATGQQIVVEDFPTLAVREALANAFVHRDYQQRGPIVVDHSPDVLAITSPGPLVAGITPQNILTHPSKPRNPLLARAARLLGLAEEVGRGVDRMFREMIASGRDIPRIESHLDDVQVTLIGGTANTQVVRFMAQLPGPERDDTDAMLVLFRLCSARTTSAPELVPLLQKPVDEVERTLRRLAADPLAILEPTRATMRRAHPAYRLRGDVLKALGNAVPYQRRTVDEIDRKIVAHVREYGKITNRTVQNLFDVGLHRARDILSDMVKRKLLAKSSGRERGPGIEYGRGARFPPERTQRRRTAKRR